VLEFSQEEAARLKHGAVGTEHLLLGLTRDSECVAAKVLSSLGVELKEVRSAVEFIVGRGESGRDGEIRLDPAAKRVIELSVDEARRLGHHYIGTEHLLLGLIREDEGIAAGVLESLGVTLEKVRTEVIKVLTQSGSSPRTSHRSTIEPSRSLPTELGTDVTAQAAENKLDPVVGREAEIEGLIQALCGRLYKIPVLVGERGVGKSAVVRGLAQRIVAGEVPEPLMHKRLILVDPGLLRGGRAFLESDLFGTAIRHDAEAQADLEAEEGIWPHETHEESVAQTALEARQRRTESGSDRQAIIESLTQRLILEIREEARNRRRFQASVESRLDAMSGMVRRAGGLDEQLKIFDESAQLAESTILFINGLPGAGAAATGVIGLLDWAVSGGKMHVIGTALPDDYRTLSSLPGARFWKLRPIEVKEQGVEETVAVLSGLRPSFELHHHVRINDEAVQTAATLADHLLNAGSMPEKAIGLLDDACSRVRMKASLPPAPLRSTRLQMQSIADDIDKALMAGEDKNNVADTCGHRSMLSNSRSDRWRTRGRRRRQSSHSK
jgi:ATP-dependent Clp protease ATP-binding subunit ClpA